MKYKAINKLVYILLQLQAATCFNNTYSRSAMMAAVSRDVGSPFFIVMHALPQGHKSTEKIFVNLKTDSPQRHSGTEKIFLLLKTYKNSVSLCLCGEKRFLYV
jgi:hypothetical protein